MKEEIDHNEMKKEIVSDTKREDKINTEIEIDVINIEREREEKLLQVWERTSAECVLVQREKNALNVEE